MTVLRALVQNMSGATVVISLLSNNIKTYHKIKKPNTHHIDSFLDFILLKSSIFFKKTITWGLFFRIDNIVNPKNGRQKL